MKKKLNILYSPTFRSDGRDNTQEVIDKFDTKKYNLILTFHPKNEIKVKGKYHEFNKQEFYCEPKLGNTDHDNIEDNKSVNIKYCNCSIF